jgi:sigma-B regulation protein RsbU (phosphoserine phosphatase)
MLTLTSRLRRIPLFAEMPPAALAFLTETAREMTYPAGAILCREGEYGDRCFIVLDGCVEIIKALGSAVERLLDIRGAGEFIGEMSLLNGDGLRTASVRARCESRVLELTRDGFDTLLRCHPSMAYEMLRVLSTRLRASNDSAIRDLYAKNQRLTQAYADLKAAQARVIEQETLLRELELAREIQESMLPPELPHVTGYDIGARMIPAHMVGGDFFDIIPLGQNRLGIAIGDVSGKGVPAALFMTLASSLLRAEVMCGTPPELALRRLNRQLMTRNAKGMFITLLYGELHVDTGEFHYVRAGHELPLVWDAQGATTEVPFSYGIPLGLFPEVVLDEQTIMLPPGGTLLLYTDGASEAMDMQGILLGHERLSTIARSLPGDSAQALCEQLLSEIVGYHDSAPQSDDITVVTVRAAATAPASRAPAS